MFGCDLLLLHAPSVYDFRKETLLFGPVSDVVPSTPVFEMYPVGFGFISEHLARLGYSTRILNLAYRMLSDCNFDPEAALARRKPRLAFGIDLHWLPHAHGAIEVARGCKRLHPNIPVVLGGLASTYFHEEIIQDEAVDFVLRGDSTERPWGMLLDALAGRGDLASVPNLTYKDGSGQVRINPLSNVEADLDLQENVYLHLFRSGVKHLDIKDMIPFHDWWKYPITAVMTCRGCTQNCAICGGSRSGYAFYCGREKIAMRSPEKLAMDVIHLARYSRGPIFLIGDLRQGGMDAARRFLDLLGPRRIKNHMVLELFSGADRDFIGRVASTFPNFNFEMSPETHDDRLRSMAGKPYTNKQVEESVRLALDHGAKKFDLYYMTGLPGQDPASVLETIEYCRSLMERFDQRLNLFISPLAPFLDPGSVAYEKADEMGYEILFRKFEDYRKALLQPSWKYTLNYRTRWMDRDQIVSSTYEAGRRLNRLKWEKGYVDPETAQQIDGRIAMAEELIAKIDAIVRDTEEGPDRRRRLLELKASVEAASASTVCGTEEIKWPLLLGGNFRFFNVGWDILFGPRPR